MPISEKFCPSHGPYDAALAVCPYCALKVNTSPQTQAGDPSRPAEIPGNIAHPLLEPSTGTPETLKPDSPCIGQPPPVSIHSGQIVQQPPRPPSAPQNQDTGLLGLLWLVNGPGRGQVYVLRDGFKAGSSPSCDVVLADPGISDIHCRFTVEEGAFVVWDFGSGTGTWVNGLRIRSATVLAENDRIRLGNQLFLLKILLESEENE